MFFFLVGCNSNKLETPSTGSDSKNRNPLTEDHSKNVDGNIVANDVPSDPEALARKLYRALSKYLDVNSQKWPQCPFAKETNSESYYQWWAKTLKPYLESDRVWSDSNFEFTPQNFPPTPMAAYREQKPWISVTPRLTDAYPAFDILPDGSSSKPNG